MLRRFKLPEGTENQNPSLSRIVLSSDATTVAFWTSDAIRMWDTAADQHRLAITWESDYPEGLSQLALSPDGRLLAATGCVDRFGGPADASFPIVLWEVRTGQRLHAWPKNRSPISTLAFTHDGRTLLSLTVDHALIGWDLASGKQLYRLATPKDQSLESIAVSADDQLMAVCSWQFHAAAQWSLSLREVNTGKLIHRLQPEPEDVNTAAFSPDGRLLAVFQGNDFERGNVAIYDLKSGRRLRQIDGPQRPDVIRLVFAPDSKTLAGTAYGSPRIYVWDVNSGRELAAPPAHDNRVCAVFFTNRGSTLLTHAYDGLLKQWDARTGAPKKLPLEKTNQVAAIVASFDRKTMVSVETSSNHVRLWDADTGKTLRKLAGGLNPHERDDASPPGVCALALARRGKTLVSAIREVVSARWLYKTCAWDVASGQLIRSSERGSDQTLLLSPDGRLALSRRAVVTETATGKELCHLRPESHDLSANALEGQFANPVTFSRDGRLLAAVDVEWDGARNRRGRAHHMAQVWEVASRQLVFAFDLPEDIASRVAFSDDGRMLISAGSAGIVIWDTASGQRPLERRGFDHRVTALGLSADGSRLATALDDTSVLVWDVSAAELGRQAKRRRAASHERDTASKFPSLWADLMSSDAKQAQSAVWTLAATPQPSASLLGEHLHVVAAATPGHLKRLVKQLDSPRFAERDKAFQELRDLDSQALSTLQQGLRAKPSAETERRIHALLDGLRSAPTPVRLREIRALQALEAMAAPEAIDVLKRLANGPPDAPLTRDAAASLERALAGAG